MIYPPRQTARILAIAKKVVRNITNASMLIMGVDTIEQKMNETSTKQNKTNKSRIKEL